ncbi:MAG: metal ABC transporter solute-binding protein, Zn/Mn family [Phycisphaerales bacterium]
MNHLKNLFLYSSLACITILGTGCSDRPSEPNHDQTMQESSPIKIVTTTGMITDPARFIAGNHATVVGIIGSGIDPHLYKPSRTDIATLSSADLILYNGLLLEGRMTDALVRIAGSGIAVRAISESIDESSLLSPPDFEGHHDPHLWMDPIAWANAVNIIAESVITQDPSNTDSYNANNNAYQQQLSALDEYAVQVLSSVPLDQRVLVTAHDAFNYFGQRYNYQVVGIQGISTESEAGVRDIERIVDLLVERKIKAVFVETTVSDRNINALIAGARARGHEVIIGGSLFSDAMGQPGTYEGTYIGMIDHNVTTIARALGGEAPKLGLNGLLSNE